MDDTNLVNCCLDSEIGVKNPGMIGYTLSARFATAPNHNGDS
jgi:hypothetical protein